MPADYENRARRAFGNSFGYASQQGSAQSGAPDGADDEKICRPFRSDVDERRSRWTGHHQYFPRDL